MTPVLQTAKDLHLNLIEGPMGDLSQFRILKAHSLVLGEWRVKAHIIGASHFISVDGNGVIFHEIFACMKVKSSAKRIYYGPIPETGNLTHRFDNGVTSSGVEYHVAEHPGIEYPCIEYKFNSKLTRWDDGESHLLELERLAHESPAGRIGLVEDFPHVNAAIDPKTIVLVKIDGKILKFETVHSYPNENRIVFTQTIIKEAL